jgi:3-hydroxymyristoyl/3-hydroxydecanoyl-(acyl carrier protein) dehydratase
MKFRMVDTIVDYKPQHGICGIKTISFEEYQLKSMFADQPSLPESLIMESLFQLGNWLIILTSDFSKIGLMVRMNQVCFEQLPGPGQRMFMDIQVRSYREDGVLFDGQAWMDHQIIARGTGCLASPVDLIEYYDPEDLRVVFSEIYRPESFRKR